jgi:hypothetical protein
MKVHKVATNSSNVCARQLSGFCALIGFDGFKINMCVDRSRQPLA